MKTIEPLTLTNDQLLGLLGSTAPGLHCNLIAAAKAEVRRRQEHDEDLNDEVIDRFHEGYFARLRGDPRPNCPYGADGWDDAERASKVRVVMPERPEGYYHAAPGTFD